MRLHRNKRQPRTGDAEAAVAEAISAGAEAQERLASASDVHTAAAEQAARERSGIISEIRAMREQNHLADLILDSVQRGKK